MMPGISASNSWARKPSTGASRRRDLSDCTLWAIRQRGCVLAARRTQSRFNRNETVPATLG
jgi:hypothetical protein